MGNPLQVRGGWEPPPVRLTKIFSVPTNLYQLTESSDLMSFFFLFNVLAIFFPFADGSPQSFKISQKTAEDII